MERLPLVQNAAPNLDLRITCRGFSLSRNHLHPQTLIRIQVPSLPDLSLFMVRFVMTRCSASEFCSQAFTFLGNRRLLVTTVHLGACRKLAAHEHHNGLSGGSSQHEQSEKFQVKASLTESK